MHKHHLIDYIEFTVLDIGAAKDFYKAAFGWGFTDYGPEYAGIQGPEGEVGGLRQATEVRKGGPLVVLYSTLWRLASRWFRYMDLPSTLNCILYICHHRSHWEVQGISAGGSKGRNLTRGCA